MRKGCMAVALRPQWMEERKEVWVWGMRADIEGTTFLPSRPWGLSAAPCRPHPTEGIPSCIYLCPKQEQN